MCVCPGDHDGNTFLTVGHGQKCPREIGIMV